MNTTQRPADPRTLLVERLTYLHGLLRWINDRWQAKAQVAQRYQPLVPLKAKWTLGAYALCAAVLTVVMTIVGTVYYRIVGQIELQEVGRSANANMHPLTVAILALPIALILASLIVLLRNRIIMPRQNARIARANQQREEHNATVWTEEQQVNAQLTQAGRDFAQHLGPNFFPQAYLHEEAVAFCTTAVHNHRANSVTDAINLYETELHRRQVLDMHAAQLNAQERTRKTAAVGNVVSAAMTGAAIGTMRAEAKQSRRANAAHAARLTEQMKQPKTVYVKKTGSWW